MLDERYPIAISTLAEALVGIDVGLHRRITNGTLDDFLDVCAPNVEVELVQVQPGVQKLDDGVRHEPNVTVVVDLLIRRDVAVRNQSSMILRRWTYRQVIRVDNVVIVFVDQGHVLRSERFLTVPAAHSILLYKCKEDHAGFSVQRVDAGL